MKKILNKKRGRPPIAKADLELPCECVGGEKSCGRLVITNFEGGDWEFALCKHRRKTGEGVFLKEDAIKKLVKLLNPHIQ